jgi:DNA-nicking Smr family endonuclease
MGKKKLPTGNKYAISIAASLDLHHHTVAEATQLLQEFFEQAQDENWQYVSIITGKGLHSANGESVLRPFVKNWLNAQGYSYLPAKRDQGGDGVIVVRIV